MKAAIYCVLIMLALGAVHAQAQSPGVVIPFDGASGSGDYPWGYHSSTAGEGYARGMADVIRSQGDYNLSTSEAAINLTEARKKDIENQKKWTQTYFDIRNINRQAFDAEQKRLRGSPEDWIRYAQAGRPKRLGPNELDSVTGEIHWPMLLTLPDYSSQRAELEKVFADRAYHGILGAEAFLRVMQLTDDVISNLKAQVRALPAEKYVAAKRFLESLAYEAGQPAG